ncbi:hypothetical protein BRC76_05465, partial [Halobacteriales archaeon QH_8_67_36]
RYFYTKGSLDGEKAIPAERLVDDEVTQLAVYDKIRALDFPPFEPAYTELGGRRLYLTATNYGDLFGSATVSTFDIEADAVPVTQR